MLKREENKEERINDLRRSLYQFEERAGLSYSPEEWAEMLQHALDSLISTHDLEAQTIAKLSIRTKKRSSRWMFAEGNVYAIPLEALGGYGYAELRNSNDLDEISGKVGKIQYVQYYNLHTQKVLSLQQLDEINPEPCIVIHTGTQGITSREWPYIGRRYRERGTFVTPRLYGSVPNFGSDQEDYYIADGIYGKRRFVSEEEARQVVNPAGTSGDFAAVYKYEQLLKSLRANRGRQGQGE